MASRRVYSDPAVAAILANINQIINGSPEHDLAVAEVEGKRLANRKLERDLGARDSLANVFFNMNDPAQIKNNAGLAYGYALQGGQDPSNLASAFLGYGGAAEAPNDQLASLMVGTGRAIRPGDAFTVERQDELATNEERVGDEREADRLSNAFKIAQMQDETKRATDDAKPATVDSVIASVLQKQARGEELTPGDMAVLAYKQRSGSGSEPSLIDVAPSDQQGMGKMLKRAYPTMEEGSDVYNKVLLRAAQLYQQTKNAPTALEQAVKEIAQPRKRWGTVMGVPIPGTTVDDYEVKPDATAPAKEPDATTSAAPDPLRMLTDDPFGAFASPDAAADLRPQASGPLKIKGGTKPQENMILKRDRGDGTYEYAIIKNGVPQPYTPN